jgi:chitinase
VNEIESAKWVLEDNTKESELIEVKKINKNLYVTKPITFPDQKFKIVVDGLDHENHKIIWVSPPKFQAIDTSNY